MRASITVALIALVVIAVAVTCAAGELTGAQTYGVRWDAGELILSSGTTLDYELVKDLYITVDMRTDYSLRSTPASRYELSLNYYPRWKLFEGCAVSVGGLYRVRSGPMFFLELSRPFDWPPAWAKTIWNWFRKE